MTKLFLENHGILLPDLKPEEYRDMREGVLKDILSSSPSDTKLAKLLIEHSKDIVDDKDALMSLLRTPAIQAQRLERWAWLTQNFDLATPYQPDPVPSYGAVLLADAVASLNADNVQFLTEQGVRLAGKVTTPLVWVDDEEALEKAKRIARVLDRVSRQQGRAESIERQAFTVTFQK